MSPTSSHPELKGTRVGSSVASLLSASHASVAKIVFRLGVTVGMRSAEVGTEVYPKGTAGLFLAAGGSVPLRDSLALRWGEHLTSGQIRGRANRIVAPSTDLHVMST